MNSEYSRNSWIYRALQPWIGPWLWVVAVVLLTGFGGDWARQLLRYERGAVLEGELWRLVTGHLVHLGWSHLWLNLVALLILGNLFQGILSRAGWWLGLLVSALAIDVGLLLFDPGVDWYVGLSGAMHGIIVLGAWQLLASQRALALVLLVGVVAKLGWEQWVGPLPFTQSAAAGPVLVNAHLYGALGGALTCAVWRFMPRLTRADPPL